jgi:hypothetical protein
MNWQHPSASRATAKRTRRESNHSAVCSDRPCSGEERERSKVLGVSRAGFVRAGAPATEQARAHRLILAESKERLRAFVNIVCPRYGGSGPAGG